MALMALLPSLLLNVHVPPVAGQVAPLENRALRSAIDAQGNLWAAWETDDGDDTNVYYSRWNGSDWQPSRPLSADPQAWERSPSLAVDIDGILWAAWSRGTGPGQASIWVSHWQTLGWSPPVQVPGTAALAGGQPVLASAADGGLWLAWVGYDGTDREIFVSRWDGAAWSAPQQIGNDDSDPQSYDTHPALVTDGNGSAWLAWTSHEGALNDEIHTSHWDGLAWSPQQQVGSSDDTPDAWPSLALDAKGLPWIAWHGVAGEGGGVWRIFTSRWNRTEASWDQEMLASSPASLAVDERHPTLAFDAKGELHLAWVISGQLSGIAHAAWDGAAWTTPNWTQTDQSLELPVRLSGGEPSILWVTPGSGPEVPVQQEPLGEMRDPLPQVLPSAPQGAVRMAEPVPNRHLAHGDSITWGLYPDVTGETSIPYPTQLEQLLDSNGIPSEVINWGKPGERATLAMDRLKLGVQTYRPEFVQIMEGTNDVSRDIAASETAYHVQRLVWVARDQSGVSGVHVIVGTLVPRLDDRNGLTHETNLAIAKMVLKENVPLADTWQAFYDYGPWSQFYRDYLHPGTTGLRIIAETFFQEMADAGWITLDNQPPTAWIGSLPTQSECADVHVNWDGQDPAPGTGIKNFDVQVSENSSTWANWLLETPGKNGIYTSSTQSSKLYFRVRARDQANNVGSYSTAKSTNIIDTHPPYAAEVYPLPPAQKAPFWVSWSGADTCAAQLTYDVQYCVGGSCTPTGGPWNNWLTSTASTSAFFSPPAPPQYGETYYFRARAYDNSNNSKLSALVSTRLAQFTLDGDILTLRDEPVAMATVTADGALAVGMLVGGGFRAYVAGEGAYDLAASRDGFGNLPPMYAVEVTGADLSGLDFVLPPLDDVVQNGGFEGDTLTPWLQSGTISQTMDVHTGYGAVGLGGDEGSSSLSQSLSLPTALTNATLSFMVKLDGDGTGNSIQVDLEGTPFSRTVLVSPGGWAHKWYDVGDLVGQDATLIFTVSGSQAVLLDEVSLGSAASGGGWTFMPIIARAATP